eukprot:COSAG01_NODE_56379_length_318_cov_14.063927_1_plen_48_part_01
MIWDSASAGIDPAAWPARARGPVSWIDPGAVAFQIMLCGPRKEKCMAA